jgi:hypothetical protein
MMTSDSVQRPEPPPKTSAPHRVRNWFLAALLAGLTTAVVQIFTGAFTTAWSWFLGLVTEEQPLEIAQYTKTPITVQNYLVPKPPGAIPPPPQELEKRGEWAARVGAVDAGTTEVRVTVTGSSSDPVVLHDLQINLVSRRPPLKGTYVVLSGGDITPVRWITVDLDASPPAIAESVDGRGILAELYPEKYKEQPEDPVTFPYEVSATQPEVFYIVAKTKACDCRWTAELFWTTGEIEGSTVIDDEGEPFRTTSAREAVVTCYAGDFGPELSC